MSSSTVDLQVTDDDDTAPPSTTRWSSPLPRALIASRAAARLDEVPAPRWGPPLPRSVVASRIADRLLPPDLDDEETKEEEDSPASVRAVGDEEEHADGDSGEWLLRFDGACRANPGPGGAGAALFKPSGPVVWTGSHYMPSNGETNNTAEYTALLLGVRAAADHGVKRLRVEGDSILVIRQVRGIFATRSTRLRRLRNAVKAEIARLDCVTLHHVDRQANGHADRLANQALDRRRSQMECGVHPDGSGCTASPTAGADQPAGTVDLTPAVAASAVDLPADIDDGEVYAPMRVSHQEVPARPSRLRLRKLEDDEIEAASEVVERLSAALSAKISDASD